MSEPFEPIPEPSTAERMVADRLPIGATPTQAERVRASVPLWFHTFALAPDIYTPGYLPPARLPPARAWGRTLRGA